MNIFHTHKFDGQKWAPVKESELISRALVPVSPLAVFRNTCTECGDLVFRTVRHGSME